MNLLQSYIKQKTKNYYRLYYYQNSFTTYNFKERFLFLQNSQFFRTETPIVFKGKVPFGINLKEIQTLLGKSHFIYSEELLPHYVTVYYKNKIRGIKNKSQLHLFNNRMFYGIQVFPYLNRVDNQELINLLRIKYQFPQSASLPIILVDLDGNRLIIDENIGLSLEYITADNNFIHSVLQAFEQIERKKILDFERNKRYLMSNL